VVRRQGALRAAVDGAGWSRYMVVEEACNEYHATALVVVARAFYAAGRRVRCRKRDDTFPVRSV
jgi:hypothetical protein